MSESIEHITVLMSVYNDSGYLRASINSILKQTYRNFEFLIIDDGSTDDTEKIISSFEDSRITYKKISHRGLASALNYGLRHSRSEWIARIDADDINVLNRLQIQTDFLIKNPAYDVIAGWSVYFEDIDTILFLLRTPTEDEEVKNFLNLHNPINHSSVIFRKSSVLSNGGYNDDFESYEDFELWLRLKDKLRFKIIPEVLAYTRMRNDSMTVTGDKKKICDLLQRNAESNFNEPGQKNLKDKLLFWVEYFYGNKNISRKHFTGDVSLRQSIAFLNTYLPVKTFNTIIKSRFRYKIQTSLKDKNKHKAELKKIMNA